MVPVLNRMAVLDIGAAACREDASMLAFSSDWTTLAGWRGLKTRLNSLRYIKGRVAKPDARHHNTT